MGDPVVSQAVANTTIGFWVIGGRWVDDQRRLPWPRVIGPYTDYQAARQSAESLNAAAAADVRYRVAADLPEPSTGQAP